MMNNLSSDAQKAYRDGYAAGFKAATLASADKPDAKRDERLRVLNILQAMQDNEHVQRAIDLINRE